MTRIRVPFELYEMVPEFYQGFFHVLAQCIVCTITWLTRQGSIDLLVHILYSPPPLTGLKICAIPVLPEGGRGGIS